MNQRLLRIFHHVNLLQNRLNRISGFSDLARYIVQKTNANQHTFFVHAAHLLIENSTQAQITRASHTSISSQWSVSSPEYCLLNPESRLSYTNYFSLCLFVYPNKTLIFLEKMMKSKLPKRPVSGGTVSGVRPRYFDYWRVGYCHSKNTSLDFRLEQAGEFHCKPDHYLSH